MALVENADNYGGADQYVIEIQEKISCDTEHHFLRSAAHQPNHLRHAKQILGPQLINGLDVKCRLSHDWFMNHLPIIRSRNQK